MNKGLQDLLEKFKILDYEIQKKKIIGILGGLGNADEKYKRMLEIIKNDNKNIFGSEILLDIYQAIMSFGSKIEELEFDDIKTKFDKITSFSNEKKKLENKERLKENEEAENLLLIL